jgi:HD-GYP domain-containing protein (c-di-GMP phosphodiesterase class II)/Tfp pilus assembly protein PilZ
MNQSQNNDDKRLYNSRIIDTYIKLIRSKYNFVDINAILDYAKMRTYEVADQGHWFTQKQVDLFYEKLVKITGNKHIAREAGRYSASPEASGVMRQYFLGFVGPLKAYEMIRNGSINFTRSSVYESRKIAPNKVEIIVTPNEGVTEKLFQCENRIGVFEAIPRLFNYNTPRIEHTECIFKGGKVCRYVISWEITPAALFKKIRNYAISISSLVVLSCLVLYPRILLNTSLPFAALFVLALCLIAENKEKKELLTSLDNLRDSSDTLIDQINLNYNNALLTNEIGQAISKQTDIDEILANVIQILKKRLDYDRGLILLTNPERTRLVFRTGFGYSDEQASFLKKTIFHLDRPESKGVFVVSFRDQRPFLINNFDEIESSLSPHSLAFAKKMGSQSFICCPIICEGESLGILAVDNLNTKKPLIQSDMSLLMGIAPVIGISIYNANLIEARVQQFRSILQVMAASIDTRDNLTAGHSEKVTEYSLGICRELGLRKDYCEMIRVASLLHDYGKIGVPDAILKKDGRLTEEEYENVKSHAAKTREILEQINFEGIYREVPEIAGSHHEKIDGSGYPKGIRGKAIPLGAKILAVADFFEAITSRRHYRDPMPLQQAFALLIEKSGTHFEKKIVSAFIKYYKESKAPFLGESSLMLLHMDIRKKRVPCFIPVSLQINETIICATAIDISVNGMYVAIEDDVHEGSAMELSFKLPDSHSGVICVKGRVAWINNARDRKKPFLPAGFGVEFLEINPAIDAINTFVGSRQEENSFYAAGKIA